MNSKECRVSELELPVSFSVMTDRGTANVLLFETGDNDFFELFENRQQYQYSTTGPTEQWDFVPPSSTIRDIKNIEQTRLSQCSSAVRAMSS